MQTNIGLNNGLAPIKRQTIIIANADLIDLTIQASLGFETYFAKVQSRQWAVSVVTMSNTSRSPLRSEAQSFLKKLRAYACQKYYYDNEHIRLHVHFVPHNYL